MAANLLFRSCRATPLLSKHYRPPSIVLMCHPRRRGKVMRDSLSVQYFQAQRRMRKVCERCPYWAGNICCVWLSRSLIFGSANNDLVWPFPIAQTITQAFRGELTATASVPSRSPNPALHDNEQSVNQETVMANLCPMSLSIANSGLERQQCRRYGQKEGSCKAGGEHYVSSESIIHHDV